MIRINNDNLSRLQLSRLPNVDFGVSADSPEYFQKQHSMISTHSYINPFIKNNSLSLSKLIPKQKQLRPLNQSQWTSRIHLSNFSQLKNDDGFLTGRKQQGLVASGLNYSMEFEKSFQVMANLQNGSKVFHKKKGEFTTYLENHLLNVEFNGPILGKERSQEKREKTRLNLLKEQQQKLSATKEKYLTKKPKCQLSPLLQKTKIHRSRLRLNEKVHNQYKQKQNVRQKSRQFELPKINKNELQNSLVEMSRHYRKFKNDNMTRNYLGSSLSSVKTLEFDRSGVIDRRVERIR